MGLQVVHSDFNDEDHARFAERLQRHLASLRELLARPGFGEGPTTLGAELELFIIDKHARAFPINRALLAQSLDSHLTLELDRFNLEYNLTPVPLAGKPFSALEAEMTDAIAALTDVAAHQGGRVVTIGILPTLRQEDLLPSALTDVPRYRALSDGIRKLRQEPLQIQIDGADPLAMTCDDVTLEGANTSFQVHLRVSPQEFADTYNAAQVSSAIALAVGANSPIFLGHRLWDETRVALFKKSVDSRPSGQGAWHRPARVSFGHGWVRHGAYELFAEVVGLFPALLPVTGSEEPGLGLREHEPPGLDELRLHNGTIWRWNRAIYDPGSGGHLRIEMRALPAGPTPLDMVANAAFLVGLTLGLRRRISDLLPYLPFDYAQYNFYRAAQHGLDAVLLWPSTSPPSPREVSVRELAQELLPVAERGLSSLGVKADEIGRMLAVIRARLENGVTGARWQRAVLDRLERGCTRDDALVRLVETYVHNSTVGNPVGAWRQDQ